jgi:Glycosyltransferases involved in cell wall biogenesis
MLEGKRVAVVVPAHEEERLIATTLGGIPGFVDRIIVVDDGSADETSERVRSFGDSRVELVVHDQNRGVGAAIVTGYKRALEEEIDVVCVMAGDNQMDPRISRRSRVPSHAVRSTMQRRTVSSRARPGS